ncbi:hypothetical protein GOP47_0029303 [Adiantum capillus-veneris]|nr:hypothetical protein GOP47_0029303 [Adiantum capillus-veneris]
MKLEEEAVTFCPRALGLDGEIGFDRVGFQHHLMHFPVERSQICENEQFAKHLAAERRPGYGNQPALHQLSMLAAAERNHYDTNDYEISRLDEASRIYDQSRFLYITVERNDDNLGRLYHHRKHNHYQYHRAENLEEDWEKTNIAPPCCCVLNCSDASIEYGSLRVRAGAERSSSFEVPLEFPVTVMANPSRLVVGCALTAKKAESFLKPALVALARSKGIVFSVIDYDKPLLQQGQFDVILHKITGEVWHQQLKAYKNNYPEAFIFDQPEAIIKVYNRKSMLQEVADLKFQHSQGNVGVPKQLVVDVDSVSISEEVARENLRFPLVVKPLWIDGTAKSHALSLAFDESGLSNLMTPLVLQEFVNHGGVMFKVYVVGHLIKVVHRPSLLDICGDEARETGVMAFPRVSSAAALAAESDLNFDAIDYPPEEMLLSLAKKLRLKLDLNLFNLDMIRDGRNGNQYYVIDINYFPGFGKVPDYETVFTEFLSSLAREREPE